MSNKSLLSTLTIATIGLGSKLFLNCLCTDVKVVGLSRLLDVLKLPQPHDRKGKGVLTVSNHISVVDDPLMWGVLPTSHYTHARPARWALGAADVCFTNPLFAAFFRQVRVIETFRGEGIKQAAVDRAITLLDAGEWVHIFPEGKITQPPHSNLNRLKWGIGRVLMEVEEIPTIIPMWLTGFDTVMPETRGFPRILPRPRKRVSVTFGESGVIQERLRSSLKQQGSPDAGGISESLKAHTRAGITRIIQEELGKLGAQVSGEVTEGIKEGKTRL